MGEVIRCDGCGNDCRPGELAYIYDLGHEVRYCPDCAAEWAQFEVTQKAEASRHQRLLELWQAEARQKLTLKLTVLDLPRVMRAPNGQPLVLG